MIDPLIRANKYLNQKLLLVDTLPEMVQTIVPIYQIKGFYPILLQSAVIYEDGVKGDRAGVSKY